MTTATTFGRLDKYTSRVTVPVPPGARRVRMTIAGVWHDPATGDPTPALLEVRVLGGPPHRPNTAVPSITREARFAVFGDTTEDLPELAKGVEITVKHPSPGMAIVVRLHDIGSNATPSPRVPPSLRLPAGLDRRAPVT